MTSEGKCAGAWYCHIYLAFSCLILLTLWFHEIFKLIFLKPSSWSKTMYAEHWRKRAWAPPWEIFLYFQYNNSVEHLWTVAYLNMLLCFQLKITFNRLFLAFYLDLVPPFYFLKWNRFFSTFIPVLRESHHYFNYLLSREVCSHLQIKRLPLMRLWYTIWVYGGSNFQNNNIKKHLPHIHSFWNCLSRHLLIIRLIIMTLF